MKNKITITNNITRESTREIIRENIRESTRENIRNKESTENLQSRKLEANPNPFMLTN